MEFVLCPKCNAKLRPDRLEKHLRKVHSQDFATRRQTIERLQSRPTQITKPRRTIGQIILEGPANKDEEVRLKHFRQKLESFYSTYFFNANIKPSLLRSFVNTSINVLGISKSDYRHAIQTQHLPSSRSRLELIAKKAIEIAEEHSALSMVEVDEASASNQLIGEGGYPADCCQRCGKFLTDVCFSQILNPNRVPRTNKLCYECFQLLPHGVKQFYYKYEYGHRPEPRGVGRKPNGEYDN